MTKYRTKEERQVTTGYSTKYALSVGIQEVRVQLGWNLEDDHVYTLDEGSGVQLRPGRDFFQGRAETEKAAKDMAKKKISSMKRQIAKLEKLAKEPKWAAHD